MVRVYYSYINRGVHLVRVYGLSLGHWHLAAVLGNLLCNDSLELEHKLCVIVIPPLMFNEQNKRHFRSKREVESSYTRTQRIANSLNELLPLLLVLM